MVSSNRGNHAAGAFEIEHKIPKKWCFSLAEHDLKIFAGVCSVLWIESSKTGVKKFQLKIERGKLEEG